MLSPKYMKMFLQEAEQLASKYVLKTHPLSHTINTTNGKYSNILKSELTPNIKTAFNPSVRDSKINLTNNKLIDNISEGTPISTLGGSSIADHMFSDPIVPDLRLKEKLGKAFKGLGIASALSTALLTGAHYSDDIIKSFNTINKSVPTERIPATDLLMKRLSDNGITDQNVINKAIENAKKINHQDFSKPKGAFVNVSDKGSIVYNSAEAVGRENGYNTFSGHGNWRTGVLKGANDIDPDKASINTIYNRNMSARDIANMIKADQNYNPDLPVKLYNCEVGKGIIPQEIADILGNKVIAGDENMVVSTGSTGALGTFPSKTIDGELKVDWNNPGNIIEFNPRKKNERGSVSILSPGPMSYIRASANENRVSGIKSDLNGMSASDIYNKISNEPYFRKDLPINLMIGGLDKKLIKEIANIHKQPVRSYSAETLLYDQYGFNGAFKKIETTERGGKKGDPSTRDLGTLYTPDQYKDRTKGIRIKSSDTPWVDYAMTQVGVKESGMKNIIEGGILEGSNSSPEINNYLKSSNKGSGLAWCASFLNWAMKNTGVKNLPKYSASSEAWSKFGTKLDNPAYGSIATFKHKGGGGHTGIVVGKDPNRAGKIIVLGGNQSDAVNYMLFDEKDAVFTYPKEYKPNYDLPLYNLDKLSPNKNQQIFEMLPERIK